MVVELDRPRSAAGDILDGGRGGPLHNIGGGKVACKELIVEVVDKVVEVVLVLKTFVEFFLQKTIWHPFERSL
jgi:hypothetical protein